MSRCIPVHRRDMVCMDMIVWNVCMHASNLAWSPAAQLLAANATCCALLVDAMLGKRGSNSEHEATLQVKTEFMQLWDGM